jgi:hypothetical protein
MNKKPSSKRGAQQAPPNNTLQASPDSWREPDKPKVSVPPRPADWNRYVDSRLKQFCLR